MQTAHTLPWLLVFMSRTEIVRHAFSFPSGGSRRLKFSDWSDHVSIFSVSLVCIVPAQRRVWFRSRFWYVTPHCHTLSESKPFGSPRRAHTDTYPYSFTVLTPFDYISRWWYYLQTWVVAWQVKRPQALSMGSTLADGEDETSGHTHFLLWVHRVMLLTRERWLTSWDSYPCVGFCHGERERTFEGERIPEHISSTQWALGVCPFLWRWKATDVKNPVTFLSSLMFQSGCWSSSCDSSQSSKKQQLG